MPLFTFGIGSKCLGVIEKDSLSVATTFINCSDPECWITEFDFSCSPICIGNKSYTMINFGDYPAAYDFAYHLGKHFGVKVKNEDDNLLRVNGYYFRAAILNTLLKIPFQTEKFT